MPGLSIHYKERIAMQDRFILKLPHPTYNALIAPVAQGCSKRLSLLNVPATDQRYRKLPPKQKKLKKFGLLYHRGQLGRTITVFNYTKVQREKY